MGIISQEICNVCKEPLIYEDDIWVSGCKCFKERQVMNRVINEHGSTPSLLSEAIQLTHLLEKTLDKISDRKCVVFDNDSIITLRHYLEDLKKEN